MRIARATFGLALLTLPTGCEVAISGPGFGGCWDPNLPGPCAPLEVWPWSPQVIAGDSIQLSTEAGGVKLESSWTITGSHGIAVISRVLPDWQGVIVRGLRPGQTTVSVHALVDSLARYGKSVAITVLDTLAISTFQFITPFGVPPIPVADSVSVFAQAKDAAGYYYGTRFASFASSDTAVMQVTRELYPTWGYGARVRAHKAGVAFLIATFRSVRDSLRIEVVP